MGALRRSQFGDRDKQGDTGRRRTQKTPLRNTCTLYTLRTLWGVIERQTVKRYLECHLAHKDGRKNVVRDCEEDSFLHGQTRERGVDSQKEKMAQSENRTYCTFKRK